MADFYDMNAAIRPQNYFASFVQGQEAGRRAKQYQQQQEDRNAFRSLSPQILAGDPGAFSQAAAIDPAAATAVQTAGDSQTRRLKGALDYFDSRRKTQNPQAVQAAFREISPFMAQLTGQPAPEVYDEATMGPAFEQLRAKVAMLPADGSGGTVHSQRVGQDGFIYNTMRDGSVVNTGVRADRQMWFRDHPGMAPELVGKDGSITAVGAPVGAPQPPPMPQSPGSHPNEQIVLDAANQMVRNGVPEQQVEQWIQSQLSAPAEASMTPAVQSAPRMVEYDPVRGGLARPSEAQTAARVEAARQGVQLQYLPVQEAIKADSAIRQAAGTATAKGEAEARLEAVQSLPRVMQESDNTIRLINQALNHPGLSIATGLQGRIDPRNYVPGSDAANFRVLLDQIKGGTFLQAFQQLKGGGAITEVEGRKAEQAIARLDTTQSEAAFREALQELSRIAENAKQRAMDKAQGAPATATPAQSGGWGIQRVD